MSTLADVLLPGFKLTHTLGLISDSSLNVVSQAVALLQRENVNVDRWVVVRSGDVLEQRIELGEMSESRALRLRDRLSALEGVRRTRVEHRFTGERSADHP